MATQTDTAVNTGTGMDTGTGMAITPTGLPATASCTASTTTHYYPQGPTSPPIWTASRSSSRPWCAAGCAATGTATTTVRRETSQQSTVRPRSSSSTSSSSQRTRASVSISVRYPVLMEGDVSAGTSAGVHQTQQGSFATCQPRLLPELPLTRMSAPRDLNLPPTLCTLYHCLISKCLSTHPW